MRVAEALSAYVADRAPVVASEDRLASSAGHLGRLLGGIDAAKLSRGDIGTYLARRVSEGVQPQTVRRELITLRAALRLAWREGHIAQPLPLPLPPPGSARQRVLSAAEVSRLRRAASVDPHLSLFVALALSTGARLSAVVELTWDRVDLQHRSIDFRAPHSRAARRKNRAVVPIGRRLARILDRAAKQATGPRVIPRSACWVSRHFRIAADAAQLSGVTAHVLRHTAATVLLRQVPLVMASRMLGHRSVAITEQVYGHLTTSDLAEAAAVLDRML